MSLILVVLNPRWPDWLWRMQTDNADEKRTNTDAAVLSFSQSETVTPNSFRGLDYARGNESIIYFIDLCKPTETYIYARKKTPLQVIIAPKHTHFCLRDH